MFLNVEVKEMVQEQNNPDSRSKQTFDINIL